jgi:hypothetical protein
MRAWQVFRVQSRFGFIDTAGNKIISPKFSDIRSFREGVAVVCRNGNWGYIRKDGTWLIEPQYKDARSFYNGMAAVLEKGKWGLIDTSAKFIIPAEYKEIRNSSEPWIAARKR